MTNGRSLLLAGLLAAAGASLAATAAEAKPARCYTTDDGYYACNFRGLDAAGSFRISAAGHPTYTIEVVERGVAYGYANFGGGAVSLPGQYIRQRSDPACWANSSTGAAICAW